VKISLIFPANEILPFEMRLFKRFVSRFVISIPCGFLGVGVALQRDIELEIVGIHDLLDTHMLVAFGEPRPE